MSFNRLLAATFYPPEYWRLDYPLTYVPMLTHKEIDTLRSVTGIDIHEQDGKITVPKDFVSDLASVPRFVWWIIAPFDIARPAVVHDYLYRQIRNQQTVNEKARAVADKIMFQAMDDIWPQIPAYKQYPIYWVVRVFGWFAARFFNPNIPDPKEYEQS